MYKMVWMDYRGHWKKCFIENIKDMFWWFIYSMLMFLNNGFHVFLLMMCFAFPCTIANVFGNIKDKTFMLMPLNKEERLSYGKCGYVIRIVMSIIFVACINVIIFAMQDHNLCANIFMLITNVIFVFQINITIKQVNGIGNIKHLTYNIFWIITVILVCIINGVVKMNTSVTTLSMINIPLILFQIFIFIQTYRKFFIESILSTTCYGDGEGYENNN